MYEPYLNKEKQYLKMNAELDNRFKEIDHTKGGISADNGKPRLNVFGNGCKVNQLPKATVPTPKQKRKEIKFGTVDQKTYRDAARSSDKIVTTSKIETTNSQQIDSTSNNNRPVVTTSPQQAPVTTAIKSNDAQAPVSPTNDGVVKKNISSEGLIKFLKSKVAILKQELEVSQQENVKNIRAYDASVESNKRSIAQIEMLSIENDSMKIQIDKLQKSLATHEAVAKEKDTDLATLHKEIAALKKQVKETNRLHNNLDKRFLKCQDDLEHMKKNLSHSQECERQQRAVNHQQKNFFEDQIKVLSKQRAGLISAYKKQLLLLDNLKRQNLCLEQSKLLQIAEKDFMKVLDWNK
ncbi:Testis-expressed protein 9, partial [Pseudolycoriella hygida]